MKIYLIGMPASGKSTLAKELASLCNITMVDTDLLIEEQEQQSIPDIFTEKGEDYFRLCEKKVLRSLADFQGIVSTGGGMPCFHENMQFIKHTGRSIFLNISVETLARRALFQAGTRPLLQASELHQLQNTLTDKLAIRNSYYHQADLILEEGKVNAQSIKDFFKL